MPIKYVIMIICALAVGLGLGYFIPSNKTPTEASATATPSPLPTADNKSTPIPAAQNPVIQDRDTLLRILARVHDSGEGFEYTEAQLKELQADPENKTYSKVLQKFVRSRLNKELATFQTIGKPVNPRSVLITTNDQRAYMVYLKQDYTHDGIWLVSGFMNYEPQGDQIHEIFKSIPIAQAPGDVKEWAQAFMKSSEWKKEFKTFGDRTYALIKSSSSLSDSVELEDVTISVGEVYIAYQSYQYTAESNKDIINDYMLLEIQNLGIRDVFFQNTYTNFPLIDGKEPVPGDESTIAHLKNKVVLDPKFMELAAMGKIRGIEFGIGAAQDEVIAKWGKPHEIGSRQVEFQRWHQVQMYFWPPDNRIGSIRILGDSVDYTLPEIRKSLGNPKSEINGEDGVWGLFYQAGDYELHINATTKDGQVESLMLKKKA